jgi:hypothetical protein
MLYNALFNYKSLRISLEKPAVPAATGGANETHSDSPIH